MFSLLLTLSSTLLLLLPPAQAAPALPSDCFLCRCPRNMQYQCGSDGRTYQNPCMFLCAQTRCPDQLRGVTIARAGQCEATITGQKTIPLGKPDVDVIFSEN